MVVRKIIWQVIWVEPLGPADFKAARRWRVHSFAREIHFNLGRPLEGAHKVEFNVVYFEGNFLTQLAPQSVARLLALADETAGKSPATVGTEFMLKQEKAFFIVEDERAGGHSETFLAKAHDSATDWPRQVTKDRAEESREHEGRIAREENFSFTQRFGAGDGGADSNGKPFKTVSMQLEH